MSALRIATNAPSTRPRGARAAEEKTPGLGERTLTALGALVKWLPAEIVAGYAAVVVAMQPEVIEGAAAQPPDVSWEAWLIALAATPVLVLVAAMVAKTTERLAARAILSIPAFALWSATIPHSVWEKWDSFEESRPLFLFGLLIVVSIFTYVAQAIAPSEE